MDDARLLDACLLLCDKLGIDVQFTRIRDITDDEVVIPSHGGLCRVRETWKVILPREWGLHQRAYALAAAVAYFDMDDMFVPPAIREMLATLKSHDAAHSPPHA